MYGLALDNKVIAMIAICGSFWTLGVTEVLMEFHVLAINPYAAGGLFCQYNIMLKSWKITETLANGYSSESTQWELSNEYQHDRV